MISKDGLYLFGKAYRIQERRHSGLVYNIETESGSYVANNISAHNCDHVKTMKGRMVDGKRVFEKNFGLKFIEISVVTDGACKDCTIREILEPEEVLGRVAASVESVNKTVQGNIVGVIKEGGAAEIQKLDQAMDILEDVSRTMLDQREFLDLEFMSKLVDVLADLQSVSDELVDQGYGRQGDPAAQQQQMGVPPLPEKIPETSQEQGTLGPNPVLTGPAIGVGSVTSPVSASATGGEKLTLPSRIKELQSKVANILEEKKGANSVEKSNQEKANQTISKLARIWENPSVKNYETEIAEGDFKVVVGSDEIIGTRGNTKVASLNVASLDADVKEALKENPRNCAGMLLDSLKTKFAGYAPTNTKEQQEMTMEAQLASQKLPLHPRTAADPQSITEDQLKGKKEGYDNHARADEKRDEITEKQLKGGYKGYEYHKLQDAPRDEITELQVRNEKWKGNATPAGKDGEWVAGVNDQAQQITEGQLEDWKKPEKLHLPSDRITEKQLSEDAENWGRRIASKEDAKKALAAGFKAIAKTAAATGAAPDEIMAVIGDMTSSNQNRIAAEKAIDTLATEKQTRQAMLARAKFHGFPKNASMGDVADYVLGSLSDAGMCGKVGFETLEMIGSQKDASAKITEAVTAGAAIDQEFSFGSQTAKDYLREVLAESTESDGISVVLEKGAVKAEAGSEKFAEAAFVLATKEAEKSGMKVTEKVHVTERKDGKIEVAMRGVKAEVKEAAKEEPKTDKKEEKSAATELAARKDARKKMVEAQFGGEAPGGPGAATGPTPGGGTTMPAAPAPGGDPTAMTPPVAGLGAPEVPGDEAMGGEEKGEALPPGSICPVCGTDSVEIRHGEFTCKECGAAGEILVDIHVTEWPSVIEDSEPEEKGEEMEGGIGGMEGGAGMEMPPVGMAAAFRVTPEMVKKAGNKPIGSYCPHCGSSSVKLAVKAGAGCGKCEKCHGEYKVETLVDTEKKELSAKIMWPDLHVAKLVNAKKAEAKAAREETKKLGAKKAELSKALKTAGLTAKFANADLKGKAAIVAGLADKGQIGK